MTLGPGHFRIVVLDEIHQRDASMHLDFLLRNIAVGIDVIGDECDAEITRTSASRLIRPRYGERVGGIGARRRERAHALRGGEFGVAGGLSTARPVGRAARVRRCGGVTRATHAARRRRRCSTTGDG